MSTFLTDFNSLAYAATFCLVIAGVVAWRRVYSRAVADVQDHVIATQRSAIQTLTEQVESLTKKVARLQSTLATVRYALRQQGIEITIEDEFVVLKRTHLPSVTTVRMRRDVVQREVERADSETFTLNEETDNGQPTNGDSASPSRDT